ILLSILMKHCKNAFHPGIQHQTDYSLSLLLKPDRGMPSLFTGVGLFSENWSLESAMQMQPLPDNVAQTPTGCAPRPDTHQVLTAQFTERIFQCEWNEGTSTDGMLHF
uniref:Uncharacterized protein n=1 Tax=Falco tinnunculus TaxID=100819 RepID=A0A8C4XM04_FALTI